MLPLLTRDVRETGLVCLHCSETLVPFEEIPAGIRNDLESWAAQYAPVHAVAHWEDPQRRTAGDYDRACESASEEAEVLLRHARRGPGAPVAPVLRRSGLGRQ